MHGLSTVDGFVEINECVVEMIKYTANEPSVGLFYIQQHTQNAVPNVVNVKNNLSGKSRETALHAEDLEDSLATVKSMKEHGSPIVDEMIEDIKRSLALTSGKEPKRGLILNPDSSSQIQNREAKFGYFSNVFMTAKEKAAALKWSQSGSISSPKQPKQGMSEKQWFPVSLLPSVGTHSSSSSMVETETDELPLSSQAVEEREEREELHVDGSSPNCNILSGHENYDDFKADREAKLREWLEGENVDESATA